VISRIAGSGKRQRVRYFLGAIVLPRIATFRHVRDQSVITGAGPAATLTVAQADGLRQEYHAGRAFDLAHRG
jgi:hypothetical protein